MNKLFQSPAFWSLIYAVLVLSREQVKNLLKTIGETAGSLHTESKRAGNTIQQANNQIFKAVEHVLDLGVDALSNGINALQSHITHVVRQLSSEKANLASQVLGSLVCLATMLTFLYADATLGFQAVQTLFPDVAVPDIFHNIGVALVAASVGTIFALGLLFWDATGFADLTPVAKMKGFAKGVFIGFVVLTALATLICVALIALNRASVVANLVDLAAFPPTIQGEIHRLAAVAHSLVIVPLLLTTFLMFRGVYGLLVIYSALVGTVSLFMQFTRLLLKILRSIVSDSGMSETTASGILLAVTNLVLLGLGWIFGVAIAGVAALTQILQKLLDVVTTPPVVIWTYVSPLVKQLLSRSPQPMPSLGNLSEEQFQYFMSHLYHSMPKTGGSPVQEAQGDPLNQIEGVEDPDRLPDIATDVSGKDNHR